MTVTLGTTASGDPLDLNLDNLIGSHLCVAANSGGGKSGAIRKLLEATHGQVQHVVLDAEDEFYTLRERFDYVIAGGEGGDVPATLANARGLASAALAHGFSLVAQINDLGDDAGAFIAEFLDALIAAPREQWRPLLVVIDEAQHFAPTSGQSVATGAIKNLLQRGRKRGFTAVVASTRVSELHPGVRGLARNWMLGLVGQSLDRRTAADQLGFAPSSAEARALQALEPRQFWGFGPAISRQPVLFTIGDVETTIVKSGQAKVPTPPAPEALRAILSGLATATTTEGLGQAEGSACEIAQVSDERVWRLEGERDDLIAEVEQLRADRDLWRDRANRYDRQIRSAVAALGYVNVNAVEPEPITIEIPAQGGGGPEVDEGQTEGRQVMTSAAPRAQAPASAARTATEKAGGGNASPAALAIAELLDRINPARVTWSQAATMTGRKASGGNFNAARKWLRESGRIAEDGDFIRSAAPEPAGMTRAEALELWKSVLTNPAPRMIDALVRGSQTPDELASRLGVQPRGGNWNNGLAQLRRNGVAELRGGEWCLARPLPGEKA